MKKSFSIVAMLCIFTNLVLAQEEAGTASKPDSHAPIGVMGDHLHKKGELMFSYRYMRMSMKDNLIGSNEVIPEIIATTIANPFAGNPGMPPTLRVVPVEMSMDMHMLGAMYAPSDKVTLMAMTMIVTNDMDHVTFQGGMGTTRLGTFNTRTSGLGDTKLSALIHLFRKENTRAHFNLGVSIPTGSITETAQVLTPMNMEPTLRTPYPMQLGSGSFDFLPGITYAGGKNKLGWGTQLMANIRTGDNDEDYRLGNRFEVNTWVSYRLADWISSSFRLKGLTIGTVDGRDVNIMAPVQTADPENHGGERLDAAVGVNLVGRQGFLREHRLALELAVPVLQNLNGPQLKTTSVFTLGWQYAFTK